MTPLRTEDKVASLALPNGIVRVDDTEDIKGALAIKEGEKGRDGSRKAHPLPPNTQYYFSTQ
jgi:hypothetical protein